MLDRARTLNSVLLLECEFNMLVRLRRVELSNGAGNLFYLHTIHAGEDRNVQKFVAGILEYFGGNGLAGLNISPNGMRNNESHKLFFRYFLLKNNAI